MAEDNWAAFATGSGNKGNNGGSDDWADFGGFESAAPVTDPQATQAGLISWAAFSPNPGSQSQMSMPSATPPLVEQELWTSQKTSSSANQVYTSSEETLQHEHPPFVAMAPANHGAERHAEVSLALANNKTESQQIVSAASKTVESFPELSKDEIELEKQLISSAKVVETIKEQTTKKLLEAEEASKSLQSEVNSVNEKLSLVEQEKMQLNKELEELKKNNETLENESKSLKETIDEQKKKYAELQEEHSKKLEDVRKAGHDALAIIVEEYKELSRQAVLEQQHKSQVELQSGLEEERNKLGDTLQQQQDTFDKVLEEERQKCADTVKDALEKQSERNKQQLEEALKLEQEKSKQAIEAALKEAREEEAKALQKAAEKAKETQKEAIEEVGKSMEKMFDEERNKFKSSIKDAIEQERHNCKLAIEEAAREERTRSRECVQETIKTTREQMMEYLEHKQQSDAQARQRHLVAMDLFLESARSQLRILMESKPSDDQGKESTGK